MRSAVLEPVTPAAPAGGPSAAAADNLAVVRMWWTVLERGWRAALLERGRAAAGGGVIVDACVRDALEPFEDFDAVVEELLACGELVVASLQLRGRVAGREVWMREAWTCRMADGAVIEVRDYPTLERALAAASGGPLTAAAA